MIEQLERQKADALRRWREADQQKHLIDQISKATVAELRARADYEAALAAWSQATRTR